MYKKISINLIKLLIVFVFIFTTPMFAHAETHVYSDIQGDWIWDASSGPYILEEPIYIPRGHKLIIKSGVEVISTTTPDGPYSITLDGDLEVLGTKDSPVKFLNLYSLYLSNNTSYIGNALFDGTGLDFVKSSSTIEFVTIKNAFNAITARASNVKISTSTLVDNSYGISSYVFQQFFQAKENNSRLENTGGIGNALVGVFDTPLDVKQNIISIHGSSILNSSYHGVFNKTFNTIDATDNWWGRESGPTPVDINGMVDVDPWKTKDPNMDEVICCSNVLFIPGIEASRLYKDEKISSGTSTNKLWEPISNTDVEKMYMNSDGKSIDPSIYTKDIINMIPGIKKIYSTFIETMDGLVNAGAINKWLPLAYDWRSGVYDLVDENIMKKVYDLASTSKTGKINIISHSNGGLLAKELMMKLESDGRSNIVEGVIFIAVPELGTPESILSMLHGYHQSIAGGLVLSKNNARIFSQNMPGAYGLIPSRKFFEKNPIAVISNLFSGNTFVSSFENLKSFLLNNPFSTSSSTNTNIPILSNSKILSLVDNMHLLVDNWKPPVGTKTVSVFGWGVPTSQGITYAKDPHCNEVGVKKCPPIFTVNTDIAGDGTVLTKSRSGNTDSVLYFNLKKLQRDILSPTTHANILESGDLLSFVKDIILNKKSDPDKPQNYKKYITEAEPVDNDKYLTIRIFSPVDVDIYDNEGHHTGATEPPREGTDVRNTENNIPGTYYADFGGSKMVILPYTDGYHVSLSGNDPGVFIVKADISQNNQVLASTTFAELPTTPLMNIDFVVGTTTETFASSTSMNIDIDGDGTTDFVGHTNTYLNSNGPEIIKDWPLYIEFIKKTILSLKLPQNIEKRLLNRIYDISKRIDKKKYKNIEKVTKKLSSKWFKSKSLTESQKSALIKALELMMSKIEENYSDKN